MSKTTLSLDGRLYDYLLSVSLREHEIQRDLREYTASIPYGGMQISPEQGQFMALLVQLMGAKRVIELGVFTGYSALAVALALPPDGKIIACDINRQWTATAQAFWQRAGVADKIELRLKPALQTLDDLLAEGRAGNFDFAFVDADKVNYPHYYERLLELIRPGGLIAIDNVLWNGKVVDAADDSEDTAAIRALNRKLQRDQRIALSLLPIGDGLSLALKH